jgi:hypothetical protein
MCCTFNFVETKNGGTLSFFSGFFSGTMYTIDNTGRRGTIEEVYIFFELLHIQVHDHYNTVLH